MSTTRPVGIYIGYEGEQYANHVEIDCSEELARWPGAEPTLYYIRPGEKTPYPAITELDGTTLTWTPDAFATEKVGVSGAAQVVFVDPGENTIIGKSPIYRLFVRVSLDNEENAPDGYESWLAALTELAVVTTHDARAAEAARDLAEGYRDDALAAKREAIAAAAAAALSETAAGESADAAAESADKARTYAELSRMQAATGGFLHLEEHEGVLYCIRTGNAGLNLFMQNGVLYYSYEEEDD